MPLRLTPGVANDLHTLFQVGRVGDRTDDQLLERFRSGAGPEAEVAFTTLVRRHGPMVLRVCRGVLNDEHDAQDAFQATFLVLVRRAESVRNRSSAGSWLHGVAHRVALRARRDAARRRAHEQRAATMVQERRRDASCEHLANQEAVDEAIRHLPEKYRAVVVLCFLEGMTQEQAAEHLGWPSGTVRGRLHRAREILRARLARRGLAWPAGALVAGVVPREAAAVPAALVASTVRAAVAAASGKAAAGGAISAGVAALVDGATRSMAGAWLKHPVTLLALGLATTSGAGLVAHLGPPRPFAGVVAPAAPEPAPARAPTPAPAPREPEAFAADAADTADASSPAPPPPAPILPGRDPSAVAFPLRGITIDGNLDDWPADVERHLIPKVHVDGSYGRPAGDGRPGSPDLAAEFSVGYDPEEQLLYLAVTVRDDELVVGNGSHLDTDAVEVYVDGLRSGRRIPQPSPGPFWQHLDLVEIPVHQYIGLPGPGKVYGTPYQTNPILLGGDLARTRTAMSYRRAGEVTTYEWAIQPFDRYPDQPTRLEPGKRIGFDVAVVDKDATPTPLGATVKALLGAEEQHEAQRPSWIYWGPEWAGLKTLDAGNLGELILAGPG